MRKLILGVLFIFWIGFVSVQAEDAATILAATGVKGGLVVHLGVGDGALTADLHTNDSYVVHGLDAIQTNVVRARALIKSRGLYGKVTVDQFDSEVLPYNDNFVNLFVSENLGNVSTTEVMRVLAPKGVAYIKTGPSWEMTVKPRPSNIDEWTHYLHDPSNNALANDDVVGPPKHLQWRAEPSWGRSHEYIGSVRGLVSTEDRFFTYYDDGLAGTTDGLPQKWVIAARSAFNGALLWKKSLGWGDVGGGTWAGQLLPRSLVANGEDVFVVMGENKSLFCLDAATGEIKKDYSVDYVYEILYADGKLLLHTKTDVDDKDTHERPATVRMLDAVTGTQLWSKTESSFMPFSLALVNSNVAYHTYNDVVLVDADSGSERWRESSYILIPRRMFETLVLTEPAVLAVLGDSDPVYAFSTTDGSPLWTNATSSVGRSDSASSDLFVTPDNRVWSGDCEAGRDLLTGAVTKTIDFSNWYDQSNGHHARCYRSKATSKYFLFPKRGVEFADLSGADNHSRHDWVRAMCQVGFMPANGILYSTADPCSCYSGVMIKGFNALRETVDYTSPSNDVRFISGAAFPSGGGSVVETKAWDWNTYRYDSKRSGNIDFNVSPTETNVWETDLGGDLTPATFADGQLYVCDKSNNTVYCLNGADGSILWEYIAGGVVDLPPTIYNETVLFGSHDGWVYCVRASDGVLAWKYRAAPEARLMLDDNQLASPWPIHGSICMLDDVAYFAAGRSTFLDGGIDLYGLDPSTGTNIYEKHLGRPYPEPRQDPGEGFDMLGTLSDILVTDGTNLFMLQMKFDKQLNELVAPEITEQGDRQMGLHMMTTRGFLDDSNSNRINWNYSERWQGFYYANQAPKAGQILVFDDNKTYGVKYFTKRTENSPEIEPENNGYLLFADNNDTEPGLVGEAGWTSVKWLPTSLSANDAFDSVALNVQKGTGFTRDELPVWSDWKDIRVRAMVGTKDKLFVMGPPDVLSPGDPYAAFDGDLGSTIQAVSKTNGTQLLQLDTESMPVFDGMIAAEGKLFVVLENGKVICPLSGPLEGAGTVASASSISVPEGSSSAFSVKLATQPTNTVTMTVAPVLGGDTSISVFSGGSLEFTTNTWDSWQSVTLRAAQDADYLNGTTVIRCSLPGLPNTDVLATEADDETDPNYSIPFTENFDALTLGPLAGQHGWTGGGAVQPGTAYSAAQALSLTTNETASHTFVGSPPKIWITLWAQPVLNEEPIDPLPTDASAVFYVNTNKQLVAYNFTNATIISSPTISNGWNKFAVRCDYVAEVWDLELNDELIVSNFAFCGTSSSFSEIEIQSLSTNQAWLDEINITDSQSGQDTDGDGLPDSWELQYFNGATNAECSATASNGLNTVEETYIAGLNPNDPDAFFTLNSLAVNSPCVMDWTAVSGRVYNIYWTSNLVNGFGIPFKTNVVGGCFTDTVHDAAAEGFYKIEVQLEP